MTERYPLAVPRKLAHKKLAGFEPLTDVYDHAAVDLDQALIAKLVDEGTEESFALAKKVFVSGAYSRSYASLTLEHPLPTDIKQFTKIHGRNEEGLEITGECLRYTKAGSKTIDVLYDTNDDNDPATTGCRVGANPDPMLEGCFGGTGVIRIDEVDGTFNYFYNRLTDNRNDRSIYSLSAHADRKMKPCDKCEYFKEFAKFDYFYGTPHYANQWITAAFDGDFVDFKNGDANFTLYDYGPRAVAIKKASSFLSIAAYVLQELEHSLVLCMEDCQTDHCRMAHVHAMEGAVAFYTGSLEGEDGSGKGSMVYNLADLLGADFRTCGPEGESTTGTSKVNLEIFEQFVQMQQNLLDRQCVAARRNKDKIAALMTVPMVQGTIRQAYITGQRPGSSLSDEAEGAALAASIVPIVARCHIDDGNIIYDNMKTGKGHKVDFRAVKEAFERNYQCMHITCEDVGGYYVDGLTGGSYYDGAEPCGFDPNAGKLSAGQIVGMTFAAFTGALLLVSVFRCCRYFHFFGLFPCIKKKRLTTFDASRAAEMA